MQYIFLEKNFIFIDFLADKDAELTELTSFAIISFVLSNRNDVNDVSKFNSQKDHDDKVFP